MMQQAMMGAMMGGAMMGGGFGLHRKPRRR